MKLITVITTLVASFFFIMAAQASDREFADIYTECGLGAMIAPRNPAVAAVTNVTWDSGTTAISSDATTPDACKGGKSKAAAFMLESYPSLERDLAQGTGEHLSTLLNIVGCEEASQSEISLALRQDFAEIVSRDGYSTQTRYEKVEGLFNIFTGLVSEQYADVCTLS